jgi:hypothetical protein
MMIEFLEPKLKKYGATRLPIREPDGKPDKHKLPAQATAAVDDNSVERPYCVSVTQPARAAVFCYYPAQTGSSIRERSA